MNPNVQFIISPKLPSEGPVEGKAFTSFIEALTDYLTTPEEVHLLELAPEHPDGWEVVGIQAAQGWDDVLDRMNELRHLPHHPLTLGESSALRG